jgi:hypothetical protein
MENFLDNLNKKFMNFQEFKCCHGKLIATTVKFNVSILIIIDKLFPRRSPALLSLHLHRKY